MGVTSKGKAASKKRQVARKSADLAPAKQHRTGVRSVRSGRQNKLVTYLQPMLAQIHDEPFNDSNWIYEAKWDGYRAIAEVQNDEVKLYSRNGLSFLQLYPKVASALSKLKNDVVLDGEIVVLNEQGRPDFQKLQQYSGADTIAYYVFDCLSFNGEDLTTRSLVERKEILKKVLGKSDVIRYSEHVAGNGKDFFNSIRLMELEGIIAKRADSTYQFGKRTGDWLKIKNQNTQETIIAGYTPPKGSRPYFGSLVLAIKQNDGYKYVGHTGTGFSNAILKELHGKLQPLITSHAPFSQKIPLHGKVTWVRPELVCNVKFTELTADGILRHPVFQGLRIDKEASEVTHLDKPVKEEKMPALKQSGKSESEILKIGGKQVAVTNVKKVYWPGENITKGDMLQYYQKVSRYILPYLKGRPQSLKRNPNGIANPGFFQKDAGDHTPDWLKTVALRAESANRTIDYILCNDAATLLYLNNLGCIELNPWHSRTTNIDKPDYLVFDLDPSDKNPFSVVVDTANVIRDILESAGAECYCKTSGSSGLHIYVPLHARYSYDAALAFAEAVAYRTEAQLPETTTTERTISKRKDRLYLDYLQNRKGQTVASVYSVRPKPGATVSTPLLWDEVNDKLHPSQFNIFTVPKRLEKMGDLFSAVLKKGTDLKKCLKNIQI
jgi:bifunctional non-homologous end joining protein LigD